MKSYRLLDPDTDQLLFQEILTDFLAYEKSTNNRNYPYEQIVKKCQFYTRAFKKENLDEFAVAGEFTDGRITGVAVGFTFQVAWESSNNPIPTWVLGLTYTKEMTSKNPNEKLNTITDLVSAHFEKLNYNSFYLVVRVSKRINRENWKKHRSISMLPYANTRYTPYLERLITCQDDIESIKFVNLRTLISPIYHRNLAILHWVLSEDLRHK